MFTEYRCFTNEVEDGVQVKEVFSFFFLLFVLFLSFLPPPPLSLLSLCRGFDPFSLQRSSGTIRRQGGDLHRRSVSGVVDVPFPSESNFRRHVLRRTFHDPSESFLSSLTHTSGSGER